MPSIRTQFEKRFSTPACRTMHEFGSANSVCASGLLALVVAFLSFVADVTCAQSPAKDDWANLTLTSAGYPPDLAGAKEFLEGLKSTTESRALTESLIEALGSENYASRQGAMLQLSTLKGADIATLREAQASENAEIRWRIRRLLEKRQLAGASLLSASLSILERTNVEDLRDLAWNGSVLANDRPSMVNLSRFIATGYKGLADEVQKRLYSSDALTRVVAIESLRLMLEAEKAAELTRPLLQDPNPWVSLGVCRVLADVGDRDCLRTLASLAGNSDQDVVSSANWLLESLTGVFSDGKATEVREAIAIAQFWQSWVDKEGQSAALRFPVARNFTARGNLQGGMLFSTGSLGKVTITNRAGEKVWDYEMPAWSAEKLRNGNVLIASYDRAEVREVTLDNQVVWRWAEAGARPIRAKPLLSGNILIADYDGLRVIELGESRQVVWRLDLGKDNCFDAERLENGNTLVATPTALMEFRPNKEKVNTWPVAGRINSVQVLPTGNFLVANHGQNAVMELNRQGEVVWRYPETGASEAFQTEDGHYLITSDRRCIELSPDRSRVRVLHNASYGSARR